MSSGTTPPSGGNAPRRRSTRPTSGSTPPSGRQQPAGGGGAGGPWAPTGAQRPAPARASSSGSGGRSNVGRSGSSGASGRTTARGAAAGGAARGAGGSRSGGTGGGGGRPPGRRRLIDYPRDGHSGIRRWLPSWRLVLGAFALLLALGVGAFVWFYATTEVPEPADFARAQTTTVYFADGETEMGRFSEQNRVIVEDSEIPEHVKQAVVAAEDRSFYENPGIDPVGIARALWNNVRGGDQQGGSSITQQYAERYYYGRTVTSYVGKMREAVLAIKLDRLEDKDEILANYLNTIYWGRGAYGIETAAQEYFGVPASELTVEQGVLLAGIIPSPNNWDPRVDPERAQQRFDYVRSGMVTTGALSQAEADALTMPETIEQQRSNTFGGPNGYLLDMVQREITSRSSITVEQLETSGFRIVTTIDPDMQQDVVDAVANMPEDTPEEVSTAVVTLEPGTGALRALYGGPDFVERPFNSATQGTAQAGSTFKPFTLVGYLEEGNSLKSVYSGRSPMQITDDWEPRNYGNQSFGTIDIVRATAQSVNTVYGQMNMEIGPAKTVEVATRAGLPEDTSGLQENPANVLGTASPTPIQLTDAFNTFAGQGMRAPWYLVESVEYLSDGAVAYEGARPAEREFDEGVMADATYAMTQVVEVGSGSRVQAVGRPVAGKTGTSNENVSAWFVGYTPQLTTAVALYANDEDGNPMTIPPFAGFGEITGSTVPAQLWADYMTAATEGMEVEQFPERADVGEPNTLEVPRVTGLTEDEARARLEGAGFEVAVERGPSDEDEGIVYAVTPTGMVAVGSTITIMVSEGPEMVEVPDVVGRSEGSAVGRLEDAGFSVDVRQEESDEPEGTVIGQDPRGGEAESGSTVRIVVSTGPAEEEPPPPGPDPEPSPDPGDPPDDEPGPPDAGENGDGGNADGPGGGGPGGGGPDA